MPKFKPTGALKVPKHNTEMLASWAALAAAYNAEHGSDLTVTAVFNGRIETKRNGLDLEDPATRASILAAVQASLVSGISGVQLDLEPYPMTPGFLSLLEELDAMFSRVGFHGRFSVTAPATTASWTPAYLNRSPTRHADRPPVLRQRKQERRRVRAVGRGRPGLLQRQRLAGDEHRACASVLSADRWHLPSVENITTATAALAAGLAAGSRVNGAGIWSGWGFLLDEEGAYEGSADRAAWQSSTVELPFSP